MNQRNFIGVCFKFSSNDRLLSESSLEILKKNIQELRKINLCSTNDNGVTPTKEQYINVDNKNLSDPPTLRRSTRFNDTRIISL